MTLPYKEYIKVQNKYCIQYLGVEEEFVKQLIDLKQKLIQKYKDVEFTISCRHEFHLKYPKNTISEHATNKNDFGYLRNLTYDNINNPIKELEKECNLNF